MKLNFRQRLFLYITVVFSIFTISIVLFEHTQEKKFRTESLEEKLDVYTQIISSKLSVTSQSEYTSTMDSLIALFPKNIRISLIDLKGNVVYDNSIRDLASFENHYNRPEIIAARTNTKGDDIRESVSNHHKYLYYAKKEANKYIRVALPYDIKTQDFLKTDNVFLYVIVGLFVVIIVLIDWVAGRFGKSIKRLNEFSRQVNSTEKLDYSFPDDELGEIGKQIAQNYLLLKTKTNEIASEREKLMQHVHNAKEGICFFTNENEVEFHNSLFLHYVNSITDDLTSDPLMFMKNEAFSKAQEFIQGQSESYLEYVIKKQGKVFSVRILVFENKNIEVIINDVTQQEKNRQLKQEITGNIAHELRTPITSIRGYLETILEQSLTVEQQRYFISKAFTQVQNLSDLIQDVSLIAKMDEAGYVFKKESIHLNQFLNQIKEDYLYLLANNQSELTIKVPDDSTILGNQNLIYSVFKNLIDNALRYSGLGSAIRIEQYKEDEEFYYFSFYDTGNGIPDETHLSHLFERFYRVSEGRTRDTGGSGLGLSIVKNAIAFHGGTITAKNRKEGGLEFLFELKKV